MAATDQTYRPQKTLDVVFGVTCVILLITTVWMFAQDYFREFKQVQRKFRDVEEAMAQRQIVELAPKAEQLQAIESAQKAVEAAQKAYAEAKDKNRRVLDELNVRRVKADNSARDIKADFDSKVSFYNIAIDERNAEVPDSPRWKQLNDQVALYDKEVKALAKKLEAANILVEEITFKMTEIREGKAKEAADQAAAEEALARAEKALKELTADFDRFHRLAEQKRWGFGDWIRTLPVIDAFASPLRIQQTVLEDLPIDYSFKRVTRYDRCTTCHLGIDRAAYDRQALAGLGQAPGDDLKAKLADAREALKKRQALGANVSPSGLALNQVALTSSQVTQFAAHPRLDVFVDVNSPHPADKVGCTICHGGQGSSTDFYNAVHSPNTTAQRAQWEKDLGWEHIHFWDVPMLPKRFVESSCIKCHYEMAGLIRDGSKNEAPKLLKGYNLVKDNGCFGCHDIAGIKGGRWVGPDLRLESDPALDELTPLERARATSDPLSPPGTMRKVGPNLRRIAEKTNEDWARKWLLSPRGFRPETKMPHFYGLTNNNKEALQGTGQELFPDVEIHSVIHFLFRRSEGYLRTVTERHKDGADVRQKDQQLFNMLTALSNPSAEEKKQLEDVRRRINQRNAALPVATLQLPPEPKDPKDRDAQLKNGRQLFSERGCLACHSHEAVTKPGLGLPPITGEAEFGPDLTRIADKLGAKPGDTESARKWLVQWIMDPNSHNPRTFMPITHLNQAEALDVATWLLSTRTGWKGEEVPEPALIELKKLARVHLEKSVPLRRQLDEMLPLEQDKEGVTKGFTPDQLKNFRPDAEERELSDPLDASKLKMYIGRKAIGTLGCYACHYVPGFHDAKPIGTPLNDWGLKRPERLAFEDAYALVQKTYHIVPERNDPKDPSKPAADWVVKDGKLPYEKFFADALEHQFREGFLHQKLNEPRSYDYARLKAWDERLRMPQFRFSRKVPGPNATPEEVAAIEKEEAEAREAVMTFILGLVAEPIPPKFVYRPPAERQAEIKGRAVLEKFNCGGCHMLRAGVYDFKVTPDVLGKLTDSQALKSSSDHPFLDHAAWAGQPPQWPGRLAAFGNPPLLLEENKSLVVRLTQSLRFQAGTPPVPLDIPASTSIEIPEAALIRQPDGKLFASPFGGTFSNLLVDYLRKLDPQRFRDVEYARLGSPPALNFEGEKTQPQWLYQFLRNPYKVREYTVLRMPKFNMSDEEARALVSYFAAVDKVSNPGAGLQAPFFAISEREDSYLRAQNAAYLERLKRDKAMDGKFANAFEERLAQLQPIWERLLRVELNAAELRLKDLEVLTAASQGEQKKSFEADRDALKKEIERLQADVDKKNYRRFQTEWEFRDAYLVDGYKLVANYGICLNCHHVGHLQPKEKLGPNLNISWQRLRPDWLEKWIANPERFMTYKTQMPQNFLADTPAHGAYFLGLPSSEIQKAEADLAEAKKKGDAAQVAALTSRVAELKRSWSRNQITAVRDVLINLPQVLEIPENRAGPVPTVIGGGK